jgi:hypothetical protein
MDFDDMEKREQLSFVLKREIVQRLARFETPGQVVKAIKVDHGVDVTPQRVQFYDPTTSAGRALAEDLKALFFETREKAKKDLDGVASYHKAIRLRRLDAMITKAIDMNNMPLAAQLLEQAAKESGGSYTNKHQHEHTGKDGKDLPAAPAAQVTIFALPDNGRG